MKPGDETPQNWQPPVQNLAQAPYQAPAQEPASSPVPLQIPQAPTVVTEPQTITQPQSVDLSQSPVVVDQSSPEDTSETPVLGNQDSSVENDTPNPEPQDADPNDDTALLRWQATEYIHHERTGLWYAALGLVVVVFIALAIFVFNSITFAILIPVMLVALVVYVRRPPSILNYTLSRKGLHINDRLYTYDQFKAFGVITHEGAHSVVLLPRKRFQVSQTVYFPEEVGESLVDMIAARLPMQEVELDAIDKLLKRLRI